MQEYILSIDTVDAKGLVYKISKIIYDNNLNIEQNSEFVDKEVNKFFMRTVINGEVHVQKVISELESVLPQNATIKLTKKQKKI